MKKVSPKRKVISTSSAKFLDNPLKRATKKKTERKIETITPTDFVPQGAEYWRTRPIDDPLRDWTYGKESWTVDYWDSSKHPHRGVVISEIVSLRPDSVAEVGCSAGPNLIMLKQALPNTRLSGIDLSQLAIDLAKEKLPSDIEVNVGDALKLPWDTQSIDILLYDAVLMYIPHPEIEKAIDEIERVARKGMVLVERHSEDLKGEVVGHVWGRDYKTLLERRGFKVKEVKITSEMWPTSQNWVKYGRIYVGSSTK